jgi:ribosome assembly protein RRB1
VEDIQWSPTEETVFASCGADGSLRIWDTRERGRPMLSVPQAHACDVNVISWNRPVSYMLASGADDGCLSVWDLRTFAGGGGGAAAGGGAAHVAQFNYHRCDRGRY